MSKENTRTVVMTPVDNFDRKAQAPIDPSKNRTAEFGNLEVTKIRDAATGRESAKTAHDLDPANDQIFLDGKYWKILTSYR